MSLNNEVIIQSFWDNVFLKPNIAKYYIEDWEESLIRMDNYPTADYIVALSWMCFVEQDHNYLLEFYRNSDTLSGIDSVSELIRHWAEYKGLVAQHTPFQIKSQVSIEVKLLYYVVAAERLIDMALYEKAQSLLHSGLQIHKRSFESRKHVFLLGHIYYCLARISLHNHSEFEYDEWYVKFNNLIRNHSLVGLEKRKSILLVIKGAITQELSSFKFWSSLQPLEWIAYSDEVVLIHLSVLAYMTDDSAYFEMVERDLLKEFDFQYFGNFYKLFFMFRDENNAELENVIEALLPILPEVNGYSDLMDKIPASSLLSMTKRQLSLLDSAFELHSVDLDENYYPFAHYQWEIWVQSLEKMQESIADTPNDKIRDLLLAESRSFQSLIMASSQAYMLNSQSFISIMSSLCGWMNIRYNYMESEWKGEPAFSSELILVMSKILLLANSIKSKHKSLSMNFSKAKKRVNMDIDFESSGSGGYKMDSQMASLYFDELHVFLDVISLQKITILEFSVLKLEEKLITKWQLDISLE